MGKRESECEREGENKRELGRNEGEPERVSEANEGELERVSEASYLPSVAGRRRCPKNQSGKSSRRCPLEERRSREALRKKTVGRRFGYGSDPKLGPNVPPHTGVPVIQGAFCNGLETLLLLVRMSTKRSSGNIPICFHKQRCLLGGARVEG
ncbi:hypothetical protein EJ110_NYTH05523 [Nymphaea thermarum]|nr:hypothetical protein EJ110_NYTH05523 [Nymphaea thermarum]